MPRPFTRTWTVCYYDADSRITRKENVIWDYSPNEELFRITDDDGEEWFPIGALIYACHPDPRKETS